MYKQGSWFISDGGVSLTTGWCRTNNVSIPEFMARAELPSPPHPSSFAAQVLHTKHPASCIYITYVCPLNV